MLYSAVCLAEGSADRLAILLAGLRSMVAAGSRLKYYWIYRFWIIMLERNKENEEEN